MKKILFIIWSYSLGGGAEALLTTIVNRLDPHKYQIGILEFYHSSTKKEPVNSHIEIYDPITYEGDPEYRKKMYYTYHEPDIMIRHYVPSGYDLYISFNYQIPSFLLPKGSRNIAWVHGVVYDLAESGMEEYHYLQGRAFERAMKIVTISDSTSASIQALFPEHADKVIQIHNAVNIEMVREKAACYTQTEVKHPAMIWVGRLDEHKDPLRMLEIFRETVREIGSAHLYFLGKGELESQIRERVDRYGMQEQVHIMGFVDNPFPIMKQADICCMTSKSEGGPLVLLEGAALGVPFVSTDVGIARSLSNGNRCGKIFAMNTEAVNAMIEILNTPKDVIKGECFESVNRFGVEAYIAKIEQLLEEALEEEPLAKDHTAWNGTEGREILEDRKYYYRFPEGMISQNDKVILYGAGDVGTDYCHYIQETGICQMAAWVDAAAEKYRHTGKEVKDIDTIFETEYDVILIAVMAEKTSKAIRTDLCQRGILESKILWARPIF